jgi:hypothetical protein
LSKTKDWTDFIAKQVVIQAIRLGKFTSALHFSSGIGTHKNVIYSQFYTLKRKLEPYCLEERPFHFKTA